MNEGQAFLIGIVLGFLIGVISGIYTVSDHYKQSAIERGYGLYCPDTGNFAWVNECQKK